MKTIETTVYTLAELKEQFPDGYTRAFDRFQREARGHEVPWQEEIFGSLKAIVEACRLRMSNYSLGNSWDHSNNITLDYRQNAASVQDLSGKRALAYFARVLMEHGYARPTFPGWKLCFPGVCGFTGYCADEDFCESIWKNLQGGDTIKQAIEDQADTYAKMLDAEIEQDQSEENFEAQAEHMEWSFTEDGDIF